MSQALFFIPLNETFKADFDRALVLSILGSGAVQPFKGFRCDYPDESGGQAWGIDEPGEPIDGIMFDHFGGRMMMERIFELADALEVFLVWTDVGADEPNSCVVRADRLALAQKLVDDMRIVVARDASHLHDLVKGGTFEEMGGSPRRSLAIRHALGTVNRRPDRYELRRPTRGHASDPP